MQKIRWIVSVLCFVIGVAKLMVDVSLMSYTEIPTIDKIIAYVFVFFGGVAVYYTTLVEKK